MKLSLRMGWFRPVHRRSPPAQEVRALLVGRKLLQGKLLDVERSIRDLLRGFGLKVGRVIKGRFAARVRELTAGQPMPERVIEPMLRAREGLRGEYHALHRAMVDIVRADATCRRLTLAIAVRGAQSQRRWSKLKDWLGEGRAGSGASGTIAARASEPSPGNA